MANRTVVTGAEIQGSSVQLQADAGAVAGALLGVGVDPVIVEGIRQALMSAADAVHGTGFDRGGRIERDAFGERESAENLGYHHARAQAVMADTLVGVIADLAAFAEAVKRAADGLMEADTFIGQDLDKQHAAGQALAEPARRSFGDEAYDTSRNHPIDPRSAGR